MAVRLWGYRLKTIHNKHVTKREFLARIARMYYVLDMSQKDIADQLDIGRSSVGRFLTEARSEGVVQIQISSDDSSIRRTDLEHQLVEAYLLKDALVVKRVPGTTFEAEAANYLNSILPFKGSVGLTGGQTLYQVGQSLQRCDKRPDLKIVQLSGNAGNVPSTSVIQTWSQAILAKPIFIHAPAFMKNIEERQVFLKLQQIDESINEIKKLDLLIMAIGISNNEATIIQTNLLPELTGEILASKSVGDVSYHFFDENGKFTMSEIADRLVGASENDLLNVQTRIAIAYGEHKAQAIIGACRGRIINVLMTDEETAIKMLSSC